MDRGNSLPSRHKHTVNGADQQQHLDRLRDGTFIFLLLLRPFLGGEHVRSLNLGSNYPGNVLDATFSPWMTTLTIEQMLISPIADRPNLGQQNVDKGRSNFR